MLAWNNNGLKNNDDDDDDDDVEVKVKVMDRYDVEDRGIEEFHPGAFLAFGKVKLRKVAKPKIGAKRCGMEAKWSSKKMQTVQK